MTPIERRMQFLREEIPDETIEEVRSRCTEATKLAVNAGLALDEATTIFKYEFLVVSRASRLEPVI